MNIAYSYSQQKSSETIAAAHAVAQRQAVSLVDYRAGSVLQRRLRDVMNSPAQTASHNVFQFKSNSTGLPDQLKTGIENLSGHSMDDVKVHYHSSKPAQLNAHAYAQGNQIHVASGQEKHLAHEAWHVVQQKQGRVKPTMQMKGRVNVNDDRGLEHEADVMGAKAMSMGFVTQRAATGRPHYHYTPVAQLRNNTEIVYQQGTLNWRATNNPAHAAHQQEVGINTSAFIDPEDPQTGDRTGAPPANTIYTNGGGNYQAQNNGHNLTQGHLLNANLGGSAEPFNLFPITAHMNNMHSALVEDAVKYMVLNVHQQRTNEGSVGAAAFVPGGMAVGSARAASQATPVAAMGEVTHLLPAVIAAVNGIFVPLGGTPAAVTAAMVHGGNGDNTGRLAERIINAVAAAPGVTPAEIAALAGAIGGAVGGAVGASLAGVAGVGAAADTATAAGMLTAALAAAVSPVGITGAYSASPGEISNAFRTTPVGGGVALPAAGGLNWSNVRVFYRVQVDAPGIRGGPVMQPNNLANERFNCEAHYTTQDGITPNHNLPFINTTIRPGIDLNADLGNLGFTPNAQPQGLVVGPAIAPGGGVGGVAAQDAPSQHNILDAAGNIVGHATLFNHG